MEMTRLKSVMPTAANSGIFSALSVLGVPWSQAVSAFMLDADYMGNVSGNKIVSPLVDTMLIGDRLNTVDVVSLASIVFALYGSKWNKLWATMQFEYNPIENYDLTERMTGDEKITAYGRTVTRTDNLTHNKTGTETATPNVSVAKTGSDTETKNLMDAKTGTETDSPNVTEGDNYSVFGFNSAQAVPADNRSKTRTGTDQKTYNLTDTHTGTDQTTYGSTERTTGTEQTEYNTTDADTGTQTHADSGRDVETRNYTLTRHGNIGTVTSQQMIEAERELWRMWDFFREIVYPDVDRILTIETY